MRKIKRKKTLNFKKIVVLTLLGVMMTSGLSYAWLRYRWYSDGYRQAWLERDIYAHDLDFGLSTGRGPYIADGDNSKDPSVWPDVQGMIPTTPGVREITKDIIPEFKGIHKDTTSIDKIGKNIDKTEEKTMDFMKKVMDDGDKRLNHAGVAGNSSNDVFHRDKMDLSKYSTLINPENREKLDDLYGSRFNIQSGEYEPVVMSSEERRTLVESVPIIDVKDAETLHNNSLRRKAEEETFQYYKKTAEEATVARLQMFEDLKEVQNQISFLMDKDKKSTLSEKQKLAMLKALHLKMDELEMKLKHINDTEEEVTRKYKNKQQLEAQSLAAGALSIPSYDPYNPSDADKETMKSSAVNFGFLSFKK